MNQEANNPQPSVLEAWRRILATPGYFKEAAEAVAKQADQ